MYSWKAVSILIGVSVCIRSSVRPSAAQWTQSGTNAAAGRIPNRHPLRPRLPCIAQVTVHHNSTTVTRTEAARGARPRPARTVTLTEAVDPRGTIRRLRSDVGSVVAAAPSHPRRALTDARAHATRTGIAIATERDHASTQEGTDRGRGRAVDPVRETEGVAAAVTAAEIGIGTGKAADTTSGRPHMSRTR